VLVNVTRGLIETTYKTTSIPTIVITTTKEKEERIFPSTVPNLQNRVVIKKFVIPTIRTFRLPCMFNQRYATPLVISRLSLYPSPPLCFGCIVLPAMYRHFPRAIPTCYVDDDHDD
jgi:hypothetical protein